MEMMRRYAAHYPEMNLEHTRDALTMLRRASMLIRELDAYFAKHGLSQTRFLTLVVLERDDKKTQYTASDLLSRIDVSKPVMTTILRGLARDGLVETTESVRDARTRNIRITRSGRAALKRVLPGYFKLLDQHMSVPAGGSVDGNETAPRKKPRG